ncbi:hypothetical protein D3C80_1847330 [compost metagenome]
MVIVTLQGTGGPPKVVKMSVPPSVKVFGAGLICAWALDAPTPARARTRQGTTRRRFDMTNLRLKNDGLAVV